MADDNENEPTAESSEAAEKPAGTVKKKAARKKVAKKAVAKKKAVSKKATVKKRLAESAKAKAGSGSSMPEEKQAEETKPATATTVTAAAAGDAQTAARPETVIKAKFIKDEPSEVSAMSTETTSSGGFWVKVIFWLLIVVLGFMYIRSLAKHPLDQSSVTTGEASHEVATTPSTAANMASEAGAGVKDITQDAGFRPVGEADQPSGIGGGSSAGTAGDPAGSVYRSASGEVSTQQPSAQSAGVETPAGDPARGSRASSSGGTGAAPGEQQSLRAMHEESVAKILKEFDDLREAARAETEAMRNLMQAERDLRDAMTPPPPMHPPGWQAPGTGYGPHGSAPQHYPPPY
ncbi:MAG: hypothetical protein P8166_14965 [Candidatus Thiodiazotropha sp.]